jgi:glycosyltransferase involved in cell wall biosynthesis
MPPVPVSIGMPVHNGERYLEAAIRSNLGQTFADFELIISDNASTDRTEAICRDYASSDPRIRYYRNERNIGAAANYNRLFGLASAEYFRWSNADDVLAPDLIEETYKVLRSRPDVAVAYGRTGLIDAEGGLLREYDDRLDLQDDSATRRLQAFHQQVGLTNAIYGLMRASAMKNTELLGDGKSPAGDVRFMAAMTLMGKFVEVPKLLFYRRIHDGSFSSSDTQQQRKFWNASGAPFTMPHWRAELADLRAILRAPLPIAEKRRLLMYSARRLTWHRRELARDILQLFSSG